MLLRRNGALFSEGAEGLEADPVGSAVRRLLEQQATWEGTPDALLRELALPLGQAPRPRNWPLSAAALGKWLKNLAPALREMGSSLRFVAIAGGRHYLLRRDASDDSRAQTDLEEALDGLVGTAWAGVEDL